MNDIKFHETRGRELRGAHASRVLVVSSRHDELLRGVSAGAEILREWARPQRQELHTRGHTPQRSFRRDAETNTRDACAPRMLTALACCALVLLPMPVLAVGAGVSAEQKQKEMEEEVTRAANAPKADLTKLQCGNLVYAGTKSSICFADKFLSDVAANTNLNVGKNFVPVRLEADNVFDFPFCVWSGEADFSLTKKERENLRKYLLNGGFILSSPGCSDPNWDTALRKELKLIFPEYKMVKLPMSHPVFSTVNQVTRLTDKHGGQAYVEGMEVNGRLVMVYSKDGLNDVSNAKGCCCCGGNMIVEAVLVNVNVFTYALLY